MYCPECGHSIESDARFCSHCGFTAEAKTYQTDPKSSEPADPAERTGNQSGHSSQPQPQPQPYEQQPQQHYTQPAHQAYGQQPHPYAYAAPPGQAGEQQKKKKTGCLIALIILLALIGVVLFFMYRMFWGPPKDLGIRYTQTDFDSAMQKVDLTVNFEDMDSDELTEFISDHRGEKLAIDDYNWQFSNYRQREFELTPEEATAFINEVAPLFTWFDRAQANILPDGTTEGAYRVDFDKVKEELIPDVSDQIPAQISRFLPSRFNLYTKGRYEIINNEIQVSEQLDELTVGVVPMHPVIGDISQSDRNMVFEYVERVYNLIPDLMINYLRVNDEGNFEVSVYGPTHVEVTRKPGR